MTTTTRGRVTVERGEKRVRAILDGQVLADTVRPKLVWEVPYYPAYYVDAEDVATGRLTDTGETRRSPSRGTAVEVAVDGRVVGVRYDESPIDELVGTYRFDWDAIDAWFEEDEEVFVHPRNPHTRIDALHSSRHVVVEIDGTVVAESTHPVILFETGLPARYYLPKTDVRIDLLTATDTVTSCPYKGDARYWTVTIGDRVYPDVVWGYDFPVRESQPIAGLVSFYNERVDIIVDGRRLERPATKFS